MYKIKPLLVLAALNLMLLESNAQQKISFELISRWELFAHPHPNETEGAYYTKDKNGKVQKKPKGVTIKTSELNKYIGGVSSIELIDRGVFYYQFLDLNGDHKADILREPVNGFVLNKDGKIDSSTKYRNAGFWKDVENFYHGPTLPNKHYRKEQFLAVSDRYPVDGRSYAFIGSIYGSEVSEVCLFDGLADVESIRFNDSLKKLFYSFESSTSTGIASLKIYDTSFHAPQILYEETIPSANTSDNRGIEGLTLSSDNHLWMAFESAGGTSCGETSVAFYKVRMDSSANHFDFANKVKYEYPIDRCRCLKKGRIFDGTFGNGISEILAFKNDTTRFLVLERCFEAPPADVKLYVATLNEDKNTFEKELVFDFNDKSKLPYFSRDFEPDNIEGMTWGDDEDGAPILYLVSDNNFSAKQKNQLIRLKLVVID